MVKLDPDFCESFALDGKTYVIPVKVVMEIENLRSIISHFMDDIEHVMGDDVDETMKRKARAAIA